MPPMPGGGGGAGTPVGSGGGGGIPAPLPAGNAVTWFATMGGEGRSESKEGTEGGGTGGGGGFVNCALLELPLPPFFLLLC